MKKVIITTGHDDGKTVKQALVAMKKNKNEKKSLQYKKRVNYMLKGRFSVYMKKAF